MRLLWFTHFWQMLAVGLLCMLIYSEFLNWVNTLQKLLCWHVCISKPSEIWGISGNMRWDNFRIISDDCGTKSSNLLYGFRSHKSVFKLPILNLWTVNQRLKHIDPFRLTQYNTPWKEIVWSTELPNMNLQFASLINQIVLLTSQLVVDTLWIF